MTEQLSTLDKVRRLKARRPQSNNGSRMKGIFHQWHDGDNVIRLAGQFLEVRTHFIAPAPKRQDRGLCRPDAFKGDDSLPQVVNCPDWDAIKEEAKPIKTCPLCKLAAIARAIIKENNSSAEEKKFFDNLRQSASAKSNLKWNIIDRDDPNILLVDENGNEKKVLGFKISNIGMEAWNDIEGIFEQCGFDISDPKKGVDIKVIKGHNGKRVVYSAQAILEGTSLKVTPFTEEEAALQLHNLKQLCGQSTDVQKIIDALHEDLRELYEAKLDGDSAPEEVPSTNEPVVDEQAVIKEALEQESAVALDDGGDGLLMDDPAPAPAPAPAARPAVPAPAARPVAPAARPAAPAPAARPAAPAPVARPAAPAARPAAPAPAPASAIRRPVAVPGADAQKKRA